MSENADKGKVQLLIILGILCGLSLIGLLLPMFMGGGFSVRNLISLLITLALSYFTFIGHGWARITMAVLLIIGGALTLLGGFAMFMLSAVIAIIFIAIGAVYIFGAIVLLASKSIKEYQASVLNKAA